MLTVFSSLAFIALACVAAACIHATWTQYRDVALGNIAAQRSVPAVREVRYAIVGIGPRPELERQAVSRRAPVRKAARIAVRSGPLRRAA